MRDQISAHTRDPERQRSRRSRRKGAIIVLSAFLMLGIMAILALTVDLGFIQNTSVELDRAVDAGALAGAAMLPYGTVEAEAEARNFVLRNLVGNEQLAPSDVDIQIGLWDADGRSFAGGGDSPSAIRVSASRTRPLFFGRALGRNEFSLVSEAVAIFQPRDIVLVLDYSGSMNDDSELRNISSLGREYIESNLLQIYSEIGSPKYGNGRLEFAPEWMTAVGASPTNEYRPQIDVEHHYNEVSVTSTKPIDRIVLYSGSSTRTFSTPGSWNSALQRFEATVNYGSSKITRVLARSGHKGYPAANWNMYQEDFRFDSNKAMRGHAQDWFGLNGVSYPFPGGSWNSYIDYCCANNGYNKNAGYRYKFGYLNFVNYLLEKKPSYRDTPVLWDTNEQPITAVKNSVTVFLSFLQEVETDDQLALAVYNSSDGQSIVERELGQQFDQIEDISRRRQAGHYDSYTNIGAGLRAAREEMDENARPGSFKMIVLMTDGVANRPSSDPIGYVMDQVALCQDSGYPVVTVSLGAGADTALMQQVADMTGGIHFNIPGGQTVAEYEEDLKDAFREIVDIRPLRLVK